MTRDAARALADEIQRRGLATPARVLADAHRPIAPLLADLGVAIAPLLRGILGGAAGDLHALIEDPRALGRLMEEMDGVEEADARRR